MKQKKVKNIVIISYETKEDGVFLLFLVFICFVC